MADDRRYLLSGMKDEARELVLNHHYSGTMPGVVAHVLSWHASGGLFGWSGPATAAAVFGHAVGLRRLSNCLELCRLVRDPAETRPLTAFLSECLKWFRSYDRSVHLIVAYADYGGQQHHGGIYQAASWHYHGVGATCVAKISMDGQVRHTRSLVSAYGTGGVAGLRKLFPGAEIVALPPEEKHVYWRALTRRGGVIARESGFTKSPYPKPERP